MNNIIYTILIILLIIFIIVVICIFIAKFGNLDIDEESDEMKQYKVLMPIKGNGKNMNMCLERCVRGVCKKSNSKKSCKHDFQCQYCQDKSTNMFYVDFNNNLEREIVPPYEESEKLNYSQKSALNESIEKNNKYIDKLNKRIKLINS